MSLRVCWATGAAGTPFAMNTTLPSITTLRRAIVLRERITKLERKLTAALNGSIVGTRVKALGELKGTGAAYRKRTMSPARRRAFSRMMKRRWADAHKAGRNHL